MKARGCPTWLFHMLSRKNHVANIDKTKSNIWDRFLLIISMENPRYSWCFPCGTLMFHVDKWHFKHLSSANFRDDFSTPVYFLLYLSHNNDIPMVEKDFFWCFRKMKKCCIFSRVNWFISFVGCDEKHKIALFVMIFQPLWKLSCTSRTTVPYTWLKMSDSERIKNKKINILRLYFQSIFTFKNLVYFICGSLFPLIWHYEHS